VVLISSIVIAFAVTVSLNPSGVNDLAFDLMLKLIKVKSVVKIRM
jgi:hypothetical protein